MTKLIETKLIYINPIFSNFIEHYTLGRTEEVEKAYTVMKNYLKKDDINPVEYIKMEKPYKAQKMWVTHNSFPYSLPDNFDHLVVWVEDGTESEVKQLVFAMFPITQIVCVFQNKTKDQSVKNLKHYHVIIAN